MGFDLLHEIGIKNDVQSVLNPIGDILKMPLTLLQNLLGGVNSFLSGDFLIWIFLGIGGVFLISNLTKK